MKKSEIISQLKKLLFEYEEILFAYLHGSFLTVDRFKDIDIALYLVEETLKKVEVIDFEISLSLKIEKAIGLPVDIKFLNLAPLSFRYQATCGHLLFSRDELKQEEFICKTWGEYFDFQFLSLRYLKEVLSA